ncbi:MAG: GC-type dockerin domain-anchored protein [Phycisphaerales bacterium]
MRVIRCSAVFALTVGAFSAPAALAQTATWNNTTGSWSNPANWTPGPPADLATSLIFGGLGAYTVTVDVQTSCGALNINNPNAVLALQSLGSTTSALLAPNAPTHNIVGTIQLNDYNILRFDQDCTLARPFGGPSTISLGHFGRGTVTTSFGSVVTVNPNVQISGYGTVSGGYINRGIFRGTTGSYALTLSNIVYTRENNGLIRADNGWVVANTAVLNNAVIEVIGNGQFEINNAATFAGSTVITGRSLTYGGTLTLQGTWTNNGTHTLSGNNANSSILNVPQTSTIDGAGEFNIYGRAIVANGATLTLGPLQTLRASYGRLFGNIICQGPVEPFAGGFGTVFEVANNLTLAPTSMLRTNIYGTNSYSQIMGAGSLAAGGTLEVRIISPFRPAIGSTFVILDLSSGISGNFTSESLPTIVDARRYFIRKTPGRWTVVTTCVADVASLGAADFTRDGQLTADDIVGYLNAFFCNNLAVADISALGGNPIPDGQITPDDLILFLNLFFNNCNLN